MVLKWLKQFARQVVFQFTSCFRQKIVSLIRLLVWTSGADDYVTKPFSNRTSYKRVFRPSSYWFNSSGEPRRRYSCWSLQIGDLETSSRCHVAKNMEKNWTLNSQRIWVVASLSFSSWPLLPGEHFPWDCFWGLSDYFGDVRTVDVTIRRLREDWHTPADLEYI